jgi:hypothetical protein
MTTLRALASLIENTIEAIIHYPNHNRAADNLWQHTTQKAKQ